MTRDQGEKHEHYIVLAAEHIAASLETIKTGQPAAIDTPYGSFTARPDGQGVRFDDLATISAKGLKKALKKPQTLFFLTPERLEKAAFFGEQTNCYYRLRATADWPALEIGSFLMHPIKNTTPRAYSQAKLDLLQPLGKTVLDTCCGLGYTAILAAQTGAHVTVIEKDPHVVEMLEVNPMSQPLFESDRIEFIHGDSTEIVKDLPDEYFSSVMHDPPVINIAGDMYSREFYGQLLRVLRPGGRMLHYVGRPGEKYRGGDMLTSTTNRLEEVGFADVKPHEDLHCLTCRKPSL